MSRPKHWWYGTIKKMVMLAPEVKEEKTLQATIFAHAFEEALEETSKLPNGELRIKAINDILISKTKTYDGVALDVHYDRYVVVRWINSFVNLVGKKAGY